MRLLREQRLKLGLTLQNIVDSFGCFSTGAWSGIESGKTRLKPKYFQRCSEILQISMDDLKKLYPQRICPCGKSFDPSTNNQSTCSSKCWHKYNPAKPQYKQKKIDAGKCVQCADGIPMEGRKVCQRCYDKQMECNNKLKQSLAEQGLCRWCKVNPVKIKKNKKPAQMCKECSDKYNAKAKEYYYITKSNTDTYDLTKAFEEFSLWKWQTYGHTDNLVTQNIERFMEEVCELLPEERCNKETLYNALAYIMNSYDYLYGIMDTMKPSKYNKYFVIEEVASAICAFMYYFVEASIITEDWDFVDGSTRVHNGIIGEQPMYSVKEAVKIASIDSKHTHKAWSIKKTVMLVISKRVKEHRVKLGIKQCELAKVLSSYAMFEYYGSISFDKLIKILEYLNLQVNEVFKDIPKTNTVFIFD